MQPVYSPDGRTIFVRAQRRPGFESDRLVLDAYDRDRDAKRTLFETPDLSVGDYTLSQDGNSIWFTAGQDGRENLFSVPAAGGTPSAVRRAARSRRREAGDGFVVFSSRADGARRALPCDCDGGQ